MPDARVLIVDDEPDLVELVALTLDRMGLKHSTRRDTATPRRSNCWRHT